MDNALIPWGRDCQFQEHASSRNILDWDMDRDQVRSRRKTADHYSKLHQPLHYPQPKSWCQLSDFSNSMQASTALTRWQKERTWCGNGSLGSAAAAGSGNGPGMDFIFNMWEVYMPCAGIWEGKVGCVWILHVVVGKGFFFPFPFVFSCRLLLFLLLTFCLGCIKQS